MGTRTGSGGLAVSVVLHTWQSRPAFGHRVFARHCTDFLRALATMTGTRIHAHRIHPNRVELLLGPPPTGSIERYVSRWRALCVREWERRGRRTPLWEGGLDVRAITERNEVRRLRRDMLGDVDDIY